MGKQEVGLKFYWARYGVFPKFCKNQELMRIPSDCVKLEDGWKINQGQDDREYCPLSQNIKVQEIKNQIWGELQENMISQK